MGMKSIWDGEDLPPEGCEVLAHLSSEKAWVRHVVTGYKVSQGSSPYNHRVEIQLEKSDDPRSWKNARLLGDIRPLDDMAAVLDAQDEALEIARAKAKKLSDKLVSVENMVHGSGKIAKQELVDLLEG